MTKTSIVKKGLQFRSIIADCNALWEVIRKSGRDTWVCVCVNEPHEINGQMYDSDYAGTYKAFLAKDIENKIAMAQVWSEVERDHAQFYQTLKPGQIVHYRHAFKAYIRCEVVDQRFQDRKGYALKPIALVGEWSSTDLPRRMRDGSVYDSLYSEKIKNGTIFQPHAGCVYEAPGFDRNRYPDPRQMEPIDLTVPPMTPEEHKQSKLFFVLGQIEKLAGNPNEPRATLELIKSLVEDALK